MVMPIAVDDMKPNHIGSLLPHFHHLNPDRLPADRNPRRRKQRIGRHLARIDRQTPSRIIEIDKLTRTISQNLDKHTTAIKTQRQLRTAIAHTIVSQLPRLVKRPEPRTLTARIIPLALIIAAIILTAFTSSSCLSSSRRGASEPPRSHDDNNTATIQTTNNSIKATLPPRTSRHNASIKLPIFNINIPPTLLFDFHHKHPPLPGRNGRIS